jgi:hypothetical protein
MFNIASDPIPAGDCRLVGSHKLDSNSEDWDLVGQRSVLHLRFAN